MMKRTVMLYAIFLVTILMTGCIKDDGSDCPESYFLYFSYKGDGTKEIFPEKTENVNLYVYDKNEALIKTIVLNKGDLNKKQGASLDLPIGKYHVVCWGNAAQETLINGTALESGELGSPEYFKDTEIDTNDSLYYGSRDIEITETYKADTVKFLSAHIGLQLVVTGLNINIIKSNTDKSVSIVSPLIIEVGNLKPTVNFKQVYSDKKVSYYPKLNYDTLNQKVNARLDVLRFNDDNDIYISLKNKNTGKTLYKLSLMSFMQKNKITVNGKNEVHIGIVFRFSDTNIIVEPWAEEQVTPGI